MLVVQIPTFVSETPAASENYGNDTPNSFIFIVQQIATRATRDSGFPKFADSPYEVKLNLLELVGQQYYFIIVVREKFRAPDALHVLQYIFSFLCSLTLRPLGARLPILPLNPVRAFPYQSKDRLRRQKRQADGRNTPSVGVQAVFTTFNN
jgi:hypothetical protein